MTVQCTLLRRVQRWPCLSQKIHADGALTMLRLNGGVEARTQFGDDTVSGTELGQADTITLDNDAFNGGAFLGLSGENPATTDLTAYANAEAMLETEMAYQLSTNAGLRIAFDLAFTSITGSLALTICTQMARPLAQLRHKPKIRQTATAEFQNGL